MPPSNTFTRPSRRKSQDAQGPLAVSAEERFRLASDRIELMRAFGEKTQALRVAAGLSQAALARECNVSRATINKVEMGRTEPRLTTILILCAGLHISPDTLIGNLPTPNTRHPMTQPSTPSLGYTPEGGEGE